MVFTHYIRGNSLRLGDIETKSALIILHLLQKRSLGHTIDNPGRIEIISAFVPLNVSLVMKLIAQVLEWCTTQSWKL